MPAAKTVQIARSATTSGRSRSAAWSVFFEADLEGAEGEPEVGDGGLEVEVAFEVFEGGARFGGDPGADAVALALGQRGAFVGAGLGREVGAGPVEGLDGSDPGPARAEEFGDFGGGVSVGGEGDDAESEFDGERFHRRHLQGTDDDSRTEEPAQE